MLFRDRTEPTIIEHRVRERRTLAHPLSKADRRRPRRDIPVDRITDMVGNTLYGTIFLNYFSGQPKSPDVQAHDLINIVFNGILTAEERQRHSEYGRQLDTGRVENGRPCEPSSRTEAIPASS